MKNNKTRIEINIKALKDNLKIIKAKSTKAIQGVVKANAYGHGDIKVARALENMNIDSLGVARLDEGVRLRENGINKEILVLGGARENEFEALINSNLTPVIYNTDNAKKLNSYLNFRDLKLDVHLKFDTGMNRMGIPFLSVLDFLNDFKTYKNLNLKGVMSHFLAAGKKENKWNEIQIKRFSDILKALKTKAKYIHMENSASFFNFNLKNCNMARLGMAIYGYGRKDLKRVLSLYSYVKDIKKVKKGDTISYGGWYKAERDMSIAIVPVGYGDGFMRSNRKGSVFIKNKNYKIVGMICMDYFMIDISHAKDIKIDDSVEIIGKNISARSWAKASNTIVYEILTSLNPRIRRIYNDD
jgi:alanine racemase